MRAVTSHFWPRATSSLANHNTALTYYIWSQLKRQGKVQELLTCLRFDFRRWNVVVRRLRRIPRIPDWTKQKSRRRSKRGSHEPTNVHKRKTARSRHFSHRCLHTRWDCRRQPLQGTPSDIHSQVQNSHSVPKRDQTRASLPTSPQNLSMIHVHVRV